MTKKQMKISVGLYVFCAVVWTINFFIHWYTDGVPEVSTILYGVAALCFTIAAVMGVIRLIRLPKENKEEK